MKFPRRPSSYTRGFAPKIIGAAKLVPNAAQRTLCICVQNTDSQESRLPAKSDDYSLHGFAGHDLEFRKLRLVRLGVVPEETIGIKIAFFAGAYLDSSGKNVLEGKLTAAIRLDLTLTALARMRIANSALDMLFSSPIDDPW